MGFQLNQGDIEAVINCVPDAIERVLKVVQVKIERFLEKQQNKEASPMHSNKGTPIYSNYGNNQMGQNYQNRGEYE